MKKAPLGTTAEYNRPSGTVRTEEGRQIESGSVGKHEWSFGKRGLGMTQEGLGALPGLEIRAGRAVLRITVEQGQQVDEEEDVDGHSEFEFSMYVLHIGSK